MFRDLSARRRRSRSADQRAEDDRDDDTGSGTRILQTDASLRKHAQDIAAYVNVIGETKVAAEATQKRVENVEQVIEKELRQCAERFQRLEAILLELKTNRAENFQIGSPLQQA